MSDAARDGVEHTVTRGEVEVTRQLEADGRGIVGTVELTSRAAEPTLVEVTQPVPAELPVESIAFKPEASPEFKDISSDHITFRQTVEDEPAQVVFGIMLTEAVEGLTFEPPSIEAADPVGATRGASGTTDVDPDGELELDVEPKSEDEDGAGDGAEDAAGNQETLDDADEDGDAEPSRRVDPETPVSATDGGSSLDADGSTDPVADGTGRRGVELRVDRLSARVEEFATYAEALESFIDEKGTAPEFVDRVESRVDAIDDHVTTTREELDDEMETLRQELDDEIGVLRDDLDDEIGVLRDDLDDEMGTLREELEAEVASVREETTAETDELREELETTRSEVTALRDELETVRSDVTALREEVATLSDDVEELTGMRESLASALSNGPLAEPPVAGDAGDD